MNNEPTNVTGSPRIATRFRNLTLLQRFCKDIGHSATVAQRRASQSSAANSRFATRSSDFIRQLTTIAHEGRHQSKAELAHVIEQSNEVLARASTIFPLKLFPDTVILDRAKLTVIRRQFFYSEDVMSIRIEDILNVSASVGPFFGSLTVATRVLSSDDHFTINKLTRRDAQHLKHIIQGYVIARHNAIECDHLTLEQLINTLHELGQETGTTHRLPSSIRAPQRLL